MSKKPFILVTNDDGINSSGIAVLYKSMLKIGDVAVVAPDSEKSAAGHSITLSDPLRVMEVPLEENLIGYAVNGTPADCVKIGVKAVLDRQPDLVISGINLGSNTGINVIYSGTVSAATEGTILGLPCIAISLATYHNPDFRAAGAAAQLIAQEVIKHGMPANTILNVNVPNLPPEEVKGIRVTKQGKAFYDEKFDRRIDPRNRTYYWMSGERMTMEEEEGSDELLVQQGYISVTPAQYDLTHYQFLDSLKSWSLFTNGRFKLKETE